MSEVFCRGCGCEIGACATFGDCVCLVCTYKIFEKFDPGISTRPFSIEAERKVYNSLGFWTAAKFYQSPT